MRIDNRPFLVPASRHPNRSAFRHTREKKPEDYALV